MRAFYLLLFFGIVLSSCSKNFLMLDDYYARANRKERKFLKSYQRTDSICIPKIKFHHEGKTWSRILINPETIGNSLSQSYSRSFDLAFCGSNKKSPLVQDSKFLKSSKDDYRDSCCEKVVVPDLIITTRTGRNIEGGGGLTFVTDMGNDRHRIEYKLITSIYENDALVYMDNHAYWTEVFSERGEQLMYQVPQVIIDSLVTLTLQEYFKRVK